MRRYKLANVLFDPEDFLADDIGLLYHANRTHSVSYLPGKGELRFSGLVDFCTYFNSVSVGKWRKYAHLVTVRLHIELAGDACELVSRGFDIPGEGAPARCVKETSVTYDASDDFRVHEIDMPLGESVVSGFSLRTAGKVQLRNAYYYTLVEEKAVRDVRIALCTTTFKKEDYIVPNIRRIREGIVEAGEAVSEGFHLFVVDNGQTLDAEALSGDGVTVLPNCNAGGAGGFARGMMAALDSEDAFTHVLLMDDDVRMSVESIKRVHALLSLVDSAYSRACINGAMLQLEQPSLLFEDVSHVRASGGYEKLKPDLRVDALDGIVRNESIDVEVENAYGAWWFCCIPLSYVREMGLPMPFFVRCDDLEYGLRCKPVYMTMNGICVWHSRFEGRFNAAVACYQYVRNMLVTLAIHPVSREFAVRLRFWRMFNIYMRTMDYAAAELWLDGMDDYLKGPEALMGGDPYAAMGRALAKAEKFVPVEELDPQIMQELEVNLDWLSGDYSTRLVRKLAITIPHDRHWFPDFMLSSKPGMISPSVSENFVPWRKTAMRKYLVPLTPDGKRGAIRKIDRKRYRELRTRYGEVMSRYRNTRQATIEAWRSQFREMTSRAFWERYMGL